MARTRRRGIKGVRGTASRRDTHREQSCYGVADLQPGSAARTDNRSDRETTNCMTKAPNPRQAVGVPAGLAPPFGVPPYAAACRTPTPSNASTGLCTAEPPRCNTWV